ncbi:hypothetical protein AeRB84_021715, partial [Aphanomyces euteiches]
MVKPSDPAKLSADASADNQTSTPVGMHLDPSKQAKQAAAASRSRFGQTRTASGRHEPTEPVSDGTVAKSPVPHASTQEDDDDLDEWNLDAAPVGLSSNNGPRLHVLALEPLQLFGGSADGTDAASNFLRRFEENAAASDWTDDEAKCKFRLTVGRTVQDWYNQLRADERSTWKALRASFVREYILSPVPKQEVYYTMRQKENETIREYLFRFNAAATK